MADAKIHIKLEGLEFSGEGEEKWVTTQLDKVLAQASDLLRLSLAVGTGKEGGGDNIPPLEKDEPLATFLKSKGVGANQIKRFLATAIWLSRKGNTNLSTGEVTKALRDNLQPKLANPSDALRRNIGKGFCEKVGRQFFVTPDGFASMK